MPEQDFSGRLSALEKQLRLWKGITLVVVLGLITLGAAAFTQDAPLTSQGEGLLQVPARRVMANNFTLVGEDGRVYARMTIRDGAPVLSFYDEYGRVTWSAPPRLNTKPVSH